jgi:phosphoglucosamine mutase
MRENGASLGGEQSGHVVLLDRATTGDGVLTGLHLLAAVAAADKPLAALAGLMRRLPQVLVNVRVGTAPDDAIRSARSVIDDVSAQLGNQGRVLVRPSGTEPLVRVMVEAETDELARRHAEHIAAAIEEIA